MVNPLIDIMRQYDMVPLSSVIIELRQQGGGLRVQLVRLGGSSGTVAPDAEMVLAGVTGTYWEHLPDIVVTVEGEYYRHEVFHMVLASARYSYALDVLEVRRDDGETHWHYRPCNPKHWTIHQMGKRTFRLPKDQPAAVAKAQP